MVRVAAVGDVHLGAHAAGRLRPYTKSVNQLADLLLVAGDLTIIGHLTEAATFIDEFRDVSIPKVVVLGNHDHHLGHDAEIRQMLADSGYHVLEGDGVVLDVSGTRVGVAGVKGFGGGLDWDTTAVEFGEPEMRAFVAATRTAADNLEAALRGLSCDVRLALTHYSPVKDTLRGERPELYPFLGSYLLGNAIDRVGVDLVVHGHAHHGVEEGRTPAGTPVRNVAAPVIRAPFRIYSIDNGEVNTLPAPEALPRVGA